MNKARPRGPARRAADSKRAALANNGASVRRRRGRPRGAQKGQLSLHTASLMEAQESLGSIKSQAGLDLTEKVRDLLRLAKEQGHLTYDDVNDALPDELVTAEDLDQVH